MHSCSLRSRGRRRRFAGELRDLGLGDVAQQAGDEVFGTESFGLGLEVSADAVAQDGHGDFADVVDCHRKPAIHRGQGLTAIDQELPRAGAGSPIHQLAHVLRRGRLDGPG